MPSASSTSSSRGLGALPALLVAITTVVGMEAAVRSGYTPPGELMPRIADAKRTIGEKPMDVLVFGSCLGQEALDLPAIGRSLGGDVAMHALTVSGTAPLDWYLTLRNVLEPRVDMVVVAFSPADLERTTSFWQVQSLDLADATSIREMAYWSCTDSECATELYLRKASLLYRNRAYLANRVWTALSLKPPAPLRPPVNPYRERPDAAAAPHHFVERFVSLVRAAGVPFTFVELPTNPDAPDAQRKPEEHQHEVAMAFLQKIGAPEHSPQAPAGHYTDDVHVDEDGRNALTGEVATYLATVLPKPTAARP